MSHVRRTWERGRHDKGGALAAVGGGCCRSGEPSAVVSGLLVTNEAFSVAD